MNISKKYLLITSGVLFLCMSALGFLSHSLLAQEIMAQYQVKATVLLYSMKAVRQHFRTVVRPSATHEMGSDRFVTPLQSTSFAAKGVFQKIPKEYRSDMTFHIASTKPLNADNRATKLEAELIATLDAMHQRGENLTWKGLREVKGVQTYIIASGEVNRQDCLRCHSTKDAAPEELRDAYDFTGPARLAGRVESAEIVYVPMSSMAVMMTRADNAMILLSALGMLLITSAMYGSFVVLIKRPVKRLERHAEHIAGGDLDHKTPPFHGEFEHLCGAMDAMVSTLKGKIEESAAQKDIVQEQHMKLMSIINASTDLIHLKDVEGNYLIANQAYETLFGINPDDIIGKKAHEFIPGNFADQCQASDRLALEKGYCLVEERLGDRWFQTIKRSITDNKGNVTGLVGVIRDITERKEAQRLEVEMAGAEAASRAKTEFLAVMSHEIRTPMNVILGTIDLLEDTQTTTDQVLYMDTIRRSGVHLMELINDILDFSKIEAGEVTVRKHPFALSGLMEDIQGAGLMAAEKKGLDFSVTLDVDDHDLRRGDAPRLLQVIMNLVNNAVKFTTQGTVSLSVTHDANEAPDWLVFSVMDTGIGIPELKLPSIFNAFTQADSDMTIQEGGTGLGLAISKRLVELMGGTIWIHSKEHHGTTVTFRVPLPLSRSAQNQPIVEATSTGNMAGGTSSVLLAEDMKDNRFLISQYLAKAPVALHFAHNGEEAVRLCEENEYDLVLMDIRMPKMDGIEATRTIRKMEQEQGRTPVPIVALTAHAFSEFREQAMDAGCTDYLTKPISKQQLLEIIAKLTQQL